MKIVYCIEPVEHGLEAQMRWALTEGPTTAKELVATIGDAASLVETYVIVDSHAAVFGMAVPRARLAVVVDA